MQTFFLGPAGFTGLVLGFCGLAAGLVAAAEPAAEVHQRGRIRVFYHTDGRHAVDPADANRNGLPDQVEDAMTQIEAAQALFIEVLGFPDPFQSERFREARFLDVHFLERDRVRGNGVAFDELQRFRRPQDPPDTPSLCFNLATLVQASKNLSPAHEYFHLIQYGATRFKNRWYLEGLARWSERGLGLGGLGPARASGPWPLPAEKRAALSAMAYEAAEALWNPLAAACDAEGRIPDTAASRALKARHYSDGTPVLKDLRLVGWRFVRELLGELGRADAMAFREQGYDRWSEKYQSSPQNDAYLLRAVMMVLERHRVPPR